MVQARAIIYTAKLLELYAPFYACPAHGGDDRFDLVVKEVELLSCVLAALLLGTIQKPLFSRDIHKTT